LKTFIRFYIHANYREDKSDCYPDPYLIAGLESLQQKKAILRLFFEVLDFAVERLGRWKM
jgi:hypothetical protein